MRSPRSALAVAVVVCATALTTSALAADDTKTSTDASAGATATASGGATGEVTTTEAKPAPESFAAEKQDPNDPTELPGKTYYFVGLRFSETIIPSFMPKLFLAGSPPTVGVPTFGVQGGFRKDGFDIIGGISFSSVSTDPFPAKGKNEADTAYEIIKPDIKLLNLTVDFLWSAGDNVRYQFQYGVLTGLSFVFGDLSRIQSHPPNGTSPDDPNTYVPCTGPGQPGTGGYCDASNDHYGDYKEPSWFNGGSKPNVYPMFGPEIGFRWKPVHQFAARLVMGWNLFMGPFFGLTGDYGI